MPPSVHPQEGTWVLLEAQLGVCLDARLQLALALEQGEGSGFLSGPHLPHLLVGPSFYAKTCRCGLGNTPSASPVPCGAGPGLSPEWWGILGGWVPRNGLSSPGPWLLPPRLVQPQEPLPTRGQLSASTFSLAQLPARLSPPLAPSGCVIPLPSCSSSWGLPFHFVRALWF